MRRPSSLPPDWQLPSGQPLRRRVSRDNPRSNTTLRDNRYARWHAPTENEHASDSWLLSYLDLVSLLLVMFAVLLAVTQTDRHATQAQEPAQLASTLPHIEGNETTADAPNTVSDDDRSTVALVASLHKEGLNPIPEPDLSAYASPALPTPAKRAPDEWDINELGDDIDVIVNGESINFRIRSEALFAPGQAELLPSGAAVLERLLKTLERSDSRILVEGHSDATPIKNDRFPSNWELSASRAASVLRHLERGGIRSGRLRATGYADTRPIASNDTARGRAANRRVELIMETQPAQG